LELPKIDTGVNYPQPGGNPLTTGIRYRFTEENTQFRGKWPLKRGSGKRINGTISDKSDEGCTKKRPVYIAKRQRSWLWIYTCLKHSHIIGYHVISSSEGNRDAVAPLYRYMKKAPSAVFVDYACGVAEIALNWMPDFFYETAFYHDVFHGFVHKCGPVHKSTRYREFRKVNTSLMDTNQCHFATIAKSAVF
jgi:hypothetical protein